MYRILVDNEIFCDSRIDELAVINPVANLTVNHSGSFSFVIPAEHPMYDKISERTSIIDVYRDEELLFSGFCVSVEIDFFRQKSILCEGVLGFLNDTIQRPARWQGLSARELLEAYIQRHNEMSEEWKHFTVGNVTVHDSNDYMYCYTNYESTFSAIQEDLIEKLGGYLYVRHADGVRYIDYLEEPINTNTQVIKLGENLIDYNSNMDSTEIATCVIPLGAKLEESSVPGLDERLTIRSVNDGKDYIMAEEPGSIVEVVVEWDDVTTPEALKRKGEKYLSDSQFANMVLTINAIDLHIDNPEVESFKLMDKIRVVSKPHGMDRYFVLSKMTVNLNNPAGDTIVLGTNEKASMSERTVSANAEIVRRVDQIQPNEILESAKNNATSLIKSAQNGHIWYVQDENGHPKEMLIMDTDDIETATRVWRWNVNGLGYSSNGYDGPYGVAMTMDGSIVADYITAGVLSGIRINNGNGSFSVTEDGFLSAKYANITGGAVHIKGQNGNIYLKADSDTHESYVMPESFHTTDKRNGNQTVIGPASISINNGTTNRATLNSSGLSTDGTVACDTLHVSGAKQRIVNTENYGTRGLYCYESPSPMFGDIGEGETDEIGKCYVFIEDIFAETIDVEIEYQVFLQKYGQGDLWISERNSMYFVVEGTPNTRFAWEIKAVQKGFDTLRLDEFQKREDEEL